jgi:hypothetical protein
MKVVYKILSYTISVVLIWGLLNTIKPYWERYWLERELETVAIYGTKHSIYQTREMLVKKIREAGYHFEEDDFIIQKDENNFVTIYIEYSDTIRFFGRTLKHLDFIAEAKVFDING